MDSTQLNLSNLFQTIISSPHFHFITISILTLITLYISFKPNPTYLIDFSCYRPPESHRIPLSTFMEHTQICAGFDNSSINFQIKIMERCGLGQETCVPENIHQLPPDRSFHSSLLEIETIIFTAVQNLLTKHSINPNSIDILVSNCSLFSPTPSITSMLINKFQFRTDIRSFHLSGMGCSSGLLSINLANDLLKVHKNSMVLVLSMEAITPNGYPGKVKSMLLTNCLFRMGGAAILLSNRRSDRSVAKYILHHLLRTNLSSDDRSYKCVSQEEDDEGFMGVSLSKDILHVAGDALRVHADMLGPLVLPYIEQLRYGWSVIVKKWWGPFGKGTIYMPKFKKAFDHICIHAGGRAVIDVIESVLGMSKEDMEASRMTLYRFGNTSSSSIWYILCYMEAKGLVKRGDRVWQLAFGSGYKCNSAVWRCVSDLKLDIGNAWSDRIHSYPVEVPECLDH
ncbi:3-ketoacyl-CoA synthase 7-like [Magnolia sinica]|uniref:3-ketoacyl-CoA synthase 7-like n=1 Tax=Magnolia sinica TaxID=86752 RepID=UPI002659DA3D|nr:3-ketoacyl-CoA synthase 7-like [Magnolia sinica]